MGCCRALHVDDLELLGDCVSCGSITNGIRIGGLTQNLCLVDLLAHDLRDGLMDVHNRWGR